MKTAASAKSRRSHLDIIANILEIANGSAALKTQIMYKANLSFTQLNDYLAFMLNDNLIVQTRGAGKELYTVTEKGMDFLQRHTELVRLLENSAIQNKS